MALRDNARVIYTSPLKALSNQKYREFQDTFGDVGLMTGDVVINPSASCLVMTTEILRSMLYRGSEVVREVSLIVYDEIHYIKDKERGVVWEESIVMAPPTARFAFLSATIPNAREFADWIASTHKSPCHVVYTDYRPTPLVHFIYPKGADRSFLVVDERGRFREDNFGKAIGAMNDAEAEAAGAKAAKEGGSKKSTEKDEKKGGDVKTLVDSLVATNYEPVIVFSLSKTEIDRMAESLNDVDFNNSMEKDNIQVIYDSAMEVLSQEDRRLPEVTSIVERLKRGIGVHHSGMLPILKELTELLFQENLIKVLFATETFSTGLNMPTKTVVFANAKKFDGGRFRWLSSGEYIQMSGRAGRRGLDDKGTVILMLDARMDPPTAKAMLQGAPDVLHSEFHLTYAMLLNMLKVEDASPEELMKRSYRQFQMERTLPALQATLAALEEERDSIMIEDEEQVEKYAELVGQGKKLRAAVRREVMTVRHAAPFLQPGRLVKVLPPGQDAGEGGVGVWCAVVNFKMIQCGGGGGEDGALLQQLKRPKKKTRGDGYPDATKTALIDVLAICASTTSSTSSTKDRPVPVDPLTTTTTMTKVIGVTLEELLAFSELRINIPKDLRSTEQLNQAGMVLTEVQRRMPRPPLLDPVKAMHVSGEGYAKAKKRLENVESMLESHPLSGSPSLEERLTTWQKKQELSALVRAAKGDVAEAGNLILHHDLKCRRRVLRRLGFVDKEGLVTKKGRTAAEISTGDELVLCELIYNGVFGPLSVGQLAALVSCFIWREKSEVREKVPVDMEPSFAALRDVARRVGKVEVESGMQVDVEAYVESFKPDLVAAVMAWCHGVPFAKLKDFVDKKTHVGSLVRAIRRLEELLRQLQDALLAVGDAELAGKFEEARTKIKRDIIFAASLFL